MKQKNVLIILLIIVVLLLSYIAFKPKDVVAPVEQTPSGKTTTINNPNGEDYQPSDKVTDSKEIKVDGMKKYTDTDFGFSFWYPSSLKVSKSTEKK